jgi:hypothetical protein
VFCYIYEKNRIYTKPDKPETKWACLEIPNHKFQIPNKEVPFGHIYLSFAIYWQEIIIKLLTRLPAATKRKVLLDWHIFLFSSPQVFVNQMKEKKGQARLA